VNQAIRGLERLNGGICRVCRELSWVLLALMTGSIIIQVFYRYVLNDPIAWTEELAIFSMMWMAFLVAPIGYRTGAFVAIELIRDLFKGRAQAIVQIVLNLLVIAILVVLLRHSVISTIRGAGSISSSLPITMAWVYIAMPIGLSAMVLVGLEVLLKAVRALIDPRWPMMLISSTMGEAKASEFE